MSSPTNETIDEKPAEKHACIKRLLSIEVPVIVSLANKKAKLSEVLGLNVGSIIQLGKPLDDMLDLAVNDQVIGRGVTVRVNERFGLKLAKIGTPQEIIQKLGGDIAPEEPADADDSEATDEPEATDEAETTDEAKAE